MDTVAEIKAILEDDLRGHQADREIAIMDKRIEAAFAQIRDLASAGGTSLFRDRLGAMQARARELQEELITEGSMTDPQIRLLCLSSDEIVAIVYQQILGLAAREADGSLMFSVKEHTLERRIGHEVELQARLNMMKYVAAGKTRPHLETQMIALAKKYNVEKTRISKWGRKVLPACMRDIKESHVVLAGRLALHAFLPILEDLVIRHEIREAVTFSSYRITLRDDVVYKMEQEFLEMSARTSALGFMVCEPTPLTETSFNARDRYVTKIGGTKNVPLQPSAITLQAANATQNTRYTINKPVLAALEGLTQEQLDVIVGVQELPQQANEGESPRQFANRVQSVEMSNAAKRQSVPGMISAALEAMQFDAVYFPVYLDFRGRQYTVDYKGLGPQTTKTAKALLQFAEGRPLGQHGLWALYHELGNAMGYDKDIMEDKINKARNVDTTDRLWFLQAEEPLKALAIQNDIDAAIASGNPSTYVSHQIVYVDGSCNGMQHLSLMTRDEQGGRATNVVGDETAREDLYMKVAEAFMTILEDDYSDAAMYWKQFDVSQMRKRVKRGVMTLPYGVTKQGIADQVINDGFCVTKDRSHNETQQQADKFKDCLWDAMADAAPKAMELRAWMIDCVDALCSARTAPTWEAPTGTRIVKSYRKPLLKRVRIGAQYTKLPSYSETAGEVDIKKNKAAIVANLIHSFDAAMLQDTMVRMLSKQVGPMSFVHDSYGCTAGDMITMNETLRESAYVMYSNNKMEEIREGWQKLIEQDLPQCPKMGHMHPEAVLSAPYFFA